MIKNIIVVLFFFIANCVENEKELLENFCKYGVHDNVANMTILKKYRGIHKKIYVYQSNVYRSCAKNTFDIVNFHSGHMEIYTKRVIRCIQKFSGTNLSSRCQRIFQKDLNTMLAKGIALKYRICYEGIPFCDQSYYIPQFLPGNFRNYSSVGVTLDDLFMNVHQNQMVFLGSVGLTDFYQEMPTVFGCWGPFLKHRFLRNVISDTRTSLIKINGYYLEEYKTVTGCFDIAPLTNIYGTYWKELVMYMFNKNYTNTEFYFRGQNANSSCLEKICYANKCTIGADLVQCSNLCTNTISVSSFEISDMHRVDGKEYRPIKKYSEDTFTGAHKANGYILKVQKPYFADIGYDNVMGVTVSLKDNCTSRGYVLNSNNNDFTWFYHPDRKITDEFELIVINLPNNCPIFGNGIYLGHTISLETYSLYFVPYLLYFPKLEAESKVIVKAECISTETTISVGKRYFGTFHLIGKIHCGASFEKTFSNLEYFVYKGINLPRLKPIYCQPFIMRSENSLEISFPQKFFVEKRHHFTSFDTSRIEKLDTKCSETICNFTMQAFIGDYRICSDYVCTPWLLVKNSSCKFPYVKCETLKYMIYDNKTYASIVVSCVFLFSFLFGFGFVWLTCRFCFVCRYMRAVCCPNCADRESCIYKFMCCTWMCNCRCWKRNVDMQNEFDRIPLVKKHLVIAAERPRFRKARVGSVKTFMLTVLLLPLFFCVADANDIGVIDRVHNRVCCIRQCVITTVLTFASLLVIFAVLKNWGKEVWVIVAYLLSLLPGGRAQQSNDFILPASVGSCVNVTNGNFNSDICIVDRVDVYTYSLLLEGVDCEVSCVFQPGCLRTCAESEVTKKYKWVENGRECSMCYKDYWHAGGPCVSFHYDNCRVYGYDVSVAKSDSVSYIFVKYLYTKMKVIIFGKEYEFKQNSNIDDKENGFQLNMISSVTPQSFESKFVYMYRNSLYLSNFAYSNYQKDGPFSCVRKDGVVSWDETNIKFMLSTTGNCPVFPKKEKFFGITSPLFRPFDLDLNIGSNSIINTTERNINIIGNRNGIITLRVISSQPILVNTIEGVAERIVLTAGECVDYHSVIYLNVHIYGTKGYYHLNFKPALCFPRLLAIVKEDIKSRIVCKTYSDSSNYEVTIGKISRNVIGVCSNSSALDPQMWSYKSATELTGPKSDIFEYLKNAISLPNWAKWVIGAAIFLFVGFPILITLLIIFRKLWISCILSLCRKCCNDDKQN